MASTPIKVTAAQENANGYLRDLHLVAVVGPDGSTIGGGGGGPVGPVDQGAAGTQAWPVSVEGSVTVTGPVTNAQYTAVSGTASAAAWSGSGNGAIIPILKAIYEQNETIITHLSNIESNTDPIPDPED